jgi:hypothetical protein
MHGAGETREAEGPRFDVLHRVRDSAPCPRRHRPAPSRLPVRGWFTSAGAQAASSQGLLDSPGGVAGPNPVLQANPFFAVAVNEG